MSWKLTGKSKSKTSLVPEDIPGRSTTPTPGNPEGLDMHSRTGLISVKYVWASTLLTVVS
jgi:serum/glucocorticoid-regulated kinase 2